MPICPVWASSTGMRIFDQHGYLRLTCVTNNDLAVFVDAPLILEPADIAGSFPQNTATKVDGTVRTSGGISTLYGR